MRRDREHDDTEVAGQDSFLDVVANIVGILILLVMVVGLRASRAPQQQAAENPAETFAADKQQAEKAEKLARVAHARVDGLLHKLHHASRETAQNDAERVDLASYVSAAMQELEEKMLRLISDQRRDLELREQLNAAQARLERLAREQVALASYEPQVESIESLPTPLAKTVKGDEIHIRLTGGSAALIPLDELLHEFKTDAEANLWRLESRDRATVTIGPIEGFRLRYTLLKSGFTSRSGASGTIVRLQRWRLLPDATAAGEPVEQAVLPGSRLMQRVSRRSPDSTTITIWTYPDSFNEFRELKRALYERGYATAGRPLPNGVLIGGSPSGSESAAQ